MSTTSERPDEGNLAEPSAAAVPAEPDSGEQLPELAGDHRFAPEEEADGERFLEAIAVGFGDPSSDAIFRWYRRLNYPKATQMVFQDPVLYKAICDFCRTMKNVVVTSSGRISQVFCLHCCAIISEYAPNRCTGGSRQCIGTRYVDAVGAVSYLCSGCHQYEERSRRGRSRGAPSSAKTVSPGSRGRATNKASSAKPRAHTPVHTAK